MRVIPKMVWILIIMLSMGHSIPTVSVMLAPEVEHLISGLWLSMVTQRTELAVSMICLYKVLMEFLRSHSSVNKKPSVSSNKL